MNSIQFKILAFALFFMFLLTSCRKENDIVICKAGATGLLLDKIENRLSNDNSTILFFYNQLNELDSVVHKLRNGENQYKYLYDANNKLMAKRTYSSTILPKRNSEIQSVDSFTFNSKNQIIEHRIFVKTISGGYAIQNKSSYVYGVDNLLEKIISGNGTDTSSIVRYFWEDGNNVKTEHFSKNMILEHECFHSFDLNKNPFSKLPVYSYFTQSKNNIINMRLNDFTGRVDVHSPRLIKMCFNSDGFLTKKTTNDGEITYLYRNP